MRLSVATITLIGLAVWAAWPEDTSPRDSRRRVQTYRNRSAAMHPTLREGQVVSVMLFDDSTEVLREVRRGDVVVFRWPVDASRKFVKRVVGVAGDTLAMSRGVLTVNGATVSEPYAVRTDTTPLASSPEIEEVAGTLAGASAPIVTTGGPSWFRRDRTSSSATIGPTLSTVATGASSPRATSSATPLARE
jgi:signal peptidase I